MSEKITSSIRKNSLFRYLVIGSVAFGADYGVLLLAYYVLPLHLGVATSLGYFTGLLVSFLANRHWVFGKHGKDKNILIQSTQYTLLLIANYLFTVLGVRFLNEHSIPPYGGKIIVMFFIVCWNYLLFKKLIFVKQKREQ